MDVKFLILDPENPRGQIFSKIENFEKIRIHIRVVPLPSVLKFPGVSTEGAKTPIGLKISNHQPKLHDEFKTTTKFNLYT